MNQKAVERMVTHDFNQTTEQAKCTQNPPAGRGFKFFAIPGNSCPNTKHGKNMEAKT